jgi:hypothetical protein
MLGKFIPISLSIFTAFLCVLCALARVFPGSQALTALLRLEAELPSIHSQAEPGSEIKPDKIIGSRRDAEHAKRKAA